MAKKNRVQINLKKEVLLHISPTVKRASILKKGLTIGNEPSGYGVVPKVKGIYLYHENNINIIYDMVDVFEEFDVWEVSRLQGSYARPDEDSKAPTWKKSLETFGTLAYIKDIPVKNIRLKLTVHNPNFKPKL